MSYQITIVPHGHINEVLPKIIGFIRKAEPYLYGRAGTDDVIAAMMNPSIQTWIAFDEDRVVHFYCTTQLQDFPRGRNLMVLNAAGRDGVFEEIAAQFVSTVEQFARDNGCNGLDIQGRTGWRKYLTPEMGYDTTWTHYFKKLEGE